MLLRVVAASCCRVRSLVRCIRREALAACLSLMHECSFDESLCRCASPLLIGSRRLSFARRYSWALSSFAGAMYVGGFVMMTPQLFINYKVCPAVCELTVAGVRFVLRLWDALWLRLTYCLIGRSRFPSSQVLRLETFLVALLLHDCVKPLSSLPPLCTSGRLSATCNLLIVRVVRFLLSAAQVGGASAVARFRVQGPQHLHRCALVLRSRIQVSADPVS